MRTFGRIGAMTGIVVGSLILAVGARELEPSSEAAREVVALMKAGNLDAFAAADPNVPDRFVAALLVPDVQLLVVAARSTAADYVRSQLADKRYREVYSTLHSAAVPESKLFFQDMGADGLSADGEGHIDIMYERGTTQTVFDGNWRGQKLSRSEYQEKLREADAEYSRMLGLLREALRRQPDGSEVASR